MKRRRETPSPDISISHGFPLPLCRCIRSDWRQESRSGKAGLRNKSSSDKGDAGKESHKDSLTLASNGAETTISTLPPDSLNLSPSAADASALSLRSLTRSLAPSLHRRRCTDGKQGRRRVASGCCYWWADVGMCVRVCVRTACACVRSKRGERERMDAGKQHQDISP